MSYNSLDITEVMMTKLIIYKEHYHIQNFVDFFKNNQDLVDLFELELVIVEEELTTPYVCRETTSQDRAVLAKGTNACFRFLRKLKKERRNIRPQVANSDNGVDS